MYDFFTNKAQRRAAEAQYEKGYQQFLQNMRMLQMTCTCNKEAPVKIDWTKPIQWNPWGSKEPGGWNDATVVGVNSKKLRVVETSSAGLYAVTDEGRLHTNTTVHVRNKPKETKREWIEVEVYRTTNGKLVSRIKQPNMLPRSDTLVATAPVQVSYEA